MDTRKPFLVKSLRELLTISLSQSQPQMQATNIQEEEFRMSINLPYIQGTSEKLWHILRSHKVRSTSYNESILSKLLYKLKYQVATEDKDNIVYEIDCSNSKAVYFSESKWSLNLTIFVIVKRMKLQGIVEKEITALAGIRRKLWIGKAG